MTDLKDYYKECRLCPRQCGIDRTKQIGFCGAGDRIIAARIAPHYWEEPCLSGKNGSGAVFFSGCPLKCVYCQNSKISHGQGKEISLDYLADKMIYLQSLGCHNINLVTASHFIPSVAVAIEKAKCNGLVVPVVFNSSGYETVESLRLLRGLIDIYLPDMKYCDKDLAKKYSNAPDYPDTAKAALDEMYSQVGKPVIDENGIMTSGMIVRVLALPDCENNTKEILKYLKHRFSDKIYISLMSQYTPMELIGVKFPELSRKITSEEYDELCGYALGLRLDNVYFQDGEAATESFIPDFNSEEL